MSFHSDEQLMLAVRDGDLQQLGLLFDRHQARLFNFYARMTGSREASEDLVQDVFFRVLRFRHTFKPGMSFVTWMYRIARNVCVDRHRKLRRETSLEFAEGHPSPQPSPAASLEAAEEEALLHRALARLPEEKRELLVLSRFQNLKCEQIAELLGCGAGTVRARVFRAARELREIFFELRGRMAAAG